MSLTNTPTEVLQPGGNPPVINTGDMAVLLDEIYAISLVARDAPPIATAVNVTLTDADKGKTVFATADLAVNLPAVTGDYSFFLLARGGNITLNPNSSDQIEGQDDLVIGDGSSAQIIWTGSEWSAFVVGTTGASYQAFITNFLNAADQAVARAALGLTKGAAIGNVVEVEDDGNLGTRVPPALIDLTGVAAGSAIYSPTAEWQDETANRTHSTPYPNTTDYTVIVSVGGSTSSTGRILEVSATGAFAGEEIQVGTVGGNNNGNNQIPLPPGHSIRINGSTAIAYWAEFK